MKHLKTRFLVLMVSVSLVIIVLGFAGAIDIASFKKNYTESIVASYRVAGTEPVRKIEYAVKYGKPLTNFYGMQELLLDTQRDFTDILDIRVILNDGTVAYNLNEKEESNKVSEYIIKRRFSSSSPRSGASYVRDENRYHILIPINNVNKEQIGALDIVLDNSTINARIADFYNEILVYLLVIVLVSIFLIIFLISIVPVIRADGGINIGYLTATLIVILLNSQIVFGVINYNLYKKVYIQTVKENTAMVVKVVQKDMNVVIEKGVPVTELNGIETWLNSIVQSVPEVESLYITDIRGDVFYKTKNLVLMQEELINPMYNYSLPLIRDNMSQKGLVNLVLSKKFIDKKLFDIALDAITLLVISFIFMTEIIITLILLLRRKKAIAVDEGSEDDDKDAAIKLDTIRPIAFVFFFAFSLTASFIPIVMKSFNDSLLWIPEGVRLSLPVSLEALGTIISTLVTGYIIDKKGWRPPFFYGILIVCAGSVLSGAAVNGTIFVLARLVTGVGYGLSWMAMRGYVSLYSLPSAQTQGFSLLNSGIMSGLNCGVVLGAMIAERAGYSFVFYVTSGLMAISTVIALLLMGNYKKEIKNTENVKVNMDTNIDTSKDANINTNININRNINTNIGQDVKKLVCDMKVVRYILLIIVPASICGVFLNYLFPVAGAELGISSANIGRAFLLYGLFVVYLGPLFGKYAGSKVGIKSSVIGANILYAAAMLVFGLCFNSWSAFAAVVLLGFSDSFGLAAQGSYFLSFDSSKKTGGGISFAIYSVFYKVGQMIGPLVFGVLISLGIGNGTTIIGISTAILLAAFIVLSRDKKKVPVNKSVES